MPQMEVKIRFNTRYLLAILVAIAVLLIGMGIVVALLLTYTSYKTAVGIIPFFNMDLESTITSYYSSFILLISSCILALITLDRKKAGDSYWRHWCSLALGFLFMSIDESASIHEFLANIPLHYLHISTRINFSIAILGFTVTLLLFGYYLKFLLYLPANTKKRFIAAGILYVSGAFGAELAGGFISLYSHNLDTGVYLAEVVIEESLEILGIVFFIKCLFLYIEENLVSTRAVFSLLAEKTDRKVVVRR